MIRKKHYKNQEEYDGAFADAVVALKRVVEKCPEGRKFSAKIGKFTHRIECIRRDERVVAFFLFYEGVNLYASDLAVLRTLLQFIQNADGYKTLITYAPFTSWNYNKGTHVLSFDFHMHTEEPENTK